MAVIISNGNTDLHTASGFYRVEAHNLSAYSSSILTLNFTRTINVTFANAGNCQGVMLSIYVTTVHTTETITVKLKESGTERASKTLSIADITNNTAGKPGSFLVAFEFPTPYAVDTVASKWTFEISQTGAQTVFANTSNGTAPMYATWCDNAVTFADNDTVICKDQVTISQSATVRGTLGTGDSNNAPAIICAKSSTPPTKTNNAVNLQIQPSAAMTLTINGLLAWGSHGGIQVGTSTTPIPVSKKVTIDWVTPTVGTRFGVSSYGRYSAIQRGTLLFYGEYPTTYRYEMTADVAVGGTYFDTADTTGVAIGDEFYLSKIDVASNQKIEKHTVTSTTATRVNFTPATTTYARKAGGYAYKLNGLGIQLKISATSGSAISTIGLPSNYILYGVDYYGTAVSTPSYSFYTNGGSLGLADDDPAYMSKFEIKHCVRYPYNNAAQSAMFFGGYAPDLGIEISDCVAVGSTAGNQVQQNDAWGDIVMTENNNYSGMTYSGARTEASNGLPHYEITNCIFENMALGTLKGKNCVFANNYIKGGSGGGWQMYLKNFINCADWSGNVWDSCPTGIQLVESVMNLTMKDTGLSTFGTLGATSFFVPKAGCNVRDFVLESPDFTANVNLSEQSLWLEGTKVSITNENGVTNADRSLFRNGQISCTGTGLSDTTVRTSGGFAMRFEPRSGTDLMKWTQIVPTGNIQNKTMFVSVWVKINNAAYYAGTHTNPTLNVDFDNGTITSSVATNSTNWQLLSCVFTPTTTYGQIEVYVTGASDATSPNHYFYVDDMNVSYPAGVQIDLGNLDLWAEGLPVAPAIATMPSITGVWDEPLSAHTIAGSAGKILLDAANDQKLPNLLIKDKLS